MQLHRDVTYGTAFALIGAAIFWLAAHGGWNVLLVWPGVSFAVVSVAYLSGDVRWFGKRTDGTRHWLSRLALLPYFLFTKTVWIAQITISREPAAHAVNDSLVVARRLRPAEMPSDVTDVVDLTCEFTDPRSIRQRLRYTCHPILDAGSAPAAELLSSIRALPPPMHGRLLIHCANGHGRTGMFAAIWLVAHGFSTTAEDAITKLRVVRPGVGLRAGQRRVVIEAIDLIRNSDEPSDEGERG
jgi:protein-tyrosine phosphatase